MPLESHVADRAARCRRGLLCQALVSLGDVSVHEYNNTRVADIAEIPPAKRRTPGMSGTLPGRMFQSDPMTCLSKSLMLSASRSRAAAFDKRLWRLGMGHFDKVVSVDDEDSSVQVADFGSAITSQQQGDVDRHRIVTSADFLILSKNYGQSKSVGRLLMSA